MDPINLRQNFGAKYRITFDPSYDTFHVPRAKLDPWMMQIPCKFGVIYPHSDTLLAAEVDYHPNLTSRLLAIYGVTLRQDGDDEKTFIFSRAYFAQVAAILKPKKRKVLTDAQREALSKGNRFGSRNHDEKEGRIDHKPASER